jgi:phosphoribosylaminoimidazolecarboxamide formyltransferase/IMP cyclohydrolase
MPTSQTKKTTLIQRALISVSDKQGLEPFVRSLAECGVQLLSTGGTHKAIDGMGIDVSDVSSYTGFPEIMDGRVKTLHPLIHGAILGRRGKDEAAMRQHGIAPIDIVVVNLYPFEQVTASGSCTFEQGIEHIDIGGVALIRAAAKNHNSVLVVVDPEDYPRISEALNSDPACPTLRRELAQKAFAHASSYDTAISAWLATQAEGHVQGSTEGTTPAKTPERRADSTDEDLFPQQLNLGLSRHAVLRYGENPHQRAAFYTMPQSPAASIANCEQVHGREMSFNNLADADAAWQCVCDFVLPTCVIVKHANPCGVATAKTLSDAYQAARDADPTSAFGGIIAFNQCVGAKLVESILSQQFVEVLIAPDYDEDAKSAMQKKPALRALRAGGLLKTSEHRLHYKQLSGGILVQEEDADKIDISSLECATQRAPTKTELRDLAFAWKVARHVKSNAIVYAKNEATSGIGAGQMNRAMSARIAAIAAEQYQRPLQQAVMASDAFFPFRDGIDLAAKSGISAVIQPGGSKNDAEVIAAANAHDIAMLLTGIRHFRH